jgi:hypothetical protein
MRNRLKTLGLKTDICLLDSARYEMLEKSAQDIESMRLARAFFSWICALGANCNHDVWRIGHLQNTRRWWEKFPGRPRDTSETVVA